MGILVINEQNKRAIESLMPFPGVVVENMMATGVRYDFKALEGQSVTTWIQGLVDQGDAVCAFGVADCGGHYSGLRETIYAIESHNVTSVDMPYQEPQWHSGEEDPEGKGYDLYEEELAYGWMTCRDQGNYRSEIDYWFCQGCWDFSVRANGLMTPYVMEEVL